MATSGEAVRLLAEWMSWFMTDDDAPAKLPDNLHVRTALYLAGDITGPPDLVDAAHERELGT